MISDVKFVGKDDVIGMLESLTNPSIQDNALLDLGEEILRISDPKVPKRSGELKSSGFPELGNGKVFKEGGKLLVGYNSEYAGYQHQGIRKDGTRIVKNRPAGGQSFFLSATLDENRTQFMQFYKERIKKNIQKFKSK